MQATVKVWNSLEPLWYRFFARRNNRCGSSRDPTLPAGLRLAECQADRTGHADAIDAAIPVRHLVEGPLVAAVRSQH